MEKPMTRQEANRVILLELTVLVEKYPDLRFGQLLINSEIIQEEECLLDGERAIIIDGIDPFYEEPQLMLKRMQNSPFVNR